METPKLRIGKDIGIALAASVHGYKLSESDIPELIVEVRNNHTKKSTFLPCRFLSWKSSHKLHATFLGTSQTDLGTYSVTLWYRYNRSGQTMFDVNEAFTLVASTEEEENAWGKYTRDYSTVDLEGDMTLFDPKEFVLKAEFNEFKEEQQQKASIASVEDSKVFDDTEWGDIGSDIHAYAEKCFNKHYNGDPIHLAQILCRTRDGSFTAFTTQAGPNSDRLNTVILCRGNIYKADYFPAQQRLSGLWPVANEKPLRVLEQMVRALTSRLAALEAKHA